MITREQATALIQEQLVKTIFQDVPKQSAVLPLMRQLPNMTSKQTKIPVLDMLPMAYWVNGDTGFKQTSEQSWDNVYMTAAELAVIVPIPEAVMADSSYDILGEATPRVNEAMGQRIDQAILFGLNRPSEWQTDIITRARNAGNNVSGGISYDGLLGTNGLISKVEDSGHMVNGIVASVKTRSALRGIKDTTGHPLFMSDMKAATPYTLDGTSIAFPMNGSFDNTVALMVAGDFSQAVYAMRQDITVKLLDQGVIQDPTTKAIVYNLAQQDMIALRVVMRLGWALPNYATRLDEDRTTVPFAYMEPASAFTDYKVTLTVKDDATTPVAISGATVDVDGSRLKTDASGQAVYNLRTGTYPVTIKASGYRTVTDTITVSTSAVTKSITLPINA
ncbi:phage major capsid protein [Caproicibacterium amylolyticum]|uniref:Phage major capsid protein n=1 Tax=Caproicibacterium amylolyticum TaxID=2766537 RepID=A0A7G9WJF6_9FIRM|nr:phage major capsid protein [Caproicibacterium amylolyticum]QNO18818.1 phage major capsid protein [Caproicibacterium amylolyticum]